MKDTETILNEETINRISEEGLKPKTRMRKDPIEVDSFTQQQMGGEGSIYIGSSQQARRVSSRVLSKIFKNNLSNLESMRMVLKHNPELSPIDLTNILTSIGIHNLWKIDIWVLSYINIYINQRDFSPTNLPLYKAHLFMTFNIFSLR